MTGYTPTTAEVRARYTRFAYERGSEDLAQDGAGFDRWLAGVRADAWEEGVKSVNPRLSDDGGTLTFTIGLNPYKQGGKS